MILNNKIFNPNRYEAGYRLLIEQRTGLMKIRNWLVTMDEMWTLQMFDTIFARKVIYGKDFVLQTMSEVIDTNYYTMEQREVLNALREEYIHVTK